MPLALPWPAWHSKPYERGDSIALQKVTDARLEELIEQQRGYFGFLSSPRVPLKQWQEHSEAAFRVEEMLNEEACRRWLDARSKKRYESIRRRVNRKARAGR